MVQHSWAVINPCATENRESHSRYTCRRDPCTSSQKTNLFTQWTLTGYLEVWIDWCSGISVNSIKEWNFNCQWPRALVMRTPVWVVLGLFACLFPETYIKFCISCGLANDPKISTRSGKWSIAAIILRRGLPTGRMVGTAIFQVWGCPRVWIDMFWNHLYDLNISRYPEEHVSFPVGWDCKATIEPALVKNGERSGVRRTMKPRTSV